MHYTPLLLSIILAPLVTLAAPSPSITLHKRQDAPTKPKPCVALVPAPSADETNARFDKFAQAFIYKQNITEAFEYISQEYINHNPAAQNGFDSAWNILSPIWGNLTITPLRTTYKDPQGWLNYKTDAFGKVVDRFRWAGGCIAEHWDQNETYPAY